MELHTFLFTNLHKHGDCFASYLSLRKRAFVDGLGWSLAHDGTYEMDQYDHPKAAYSIVTMGGKAVAGGRALPCSSSWMGWTYMLKDAHQSKLSFIPGDLMSDYPEAHDTWECTRLVLDESELSANERATALKAVVYGLCRISRKNGGQSLISLSPASFGRLLRSIGYDAKPCGARFSGVEDGRSYRPFQMSCDPSVNRTLCAPMLIDEQNRPELLDRLMATAA